MHYSKIFAVFQTARILFVTVFTVLLLFWKLDIIDLIHILKSVKVLVIFYYVFYLYYFLMTI